MGGFDSRASARFYLHSKSVRRPWIFKKEADNNWSVSGPMMFERKKLSNQLASELFREKVANDNNGTPWKRSDGTEVPQPNAGGGSPSGEEEEFFDDCFGDEEEEGDEDRVDESSV